MEAIQTYGENGTPISKKRGDAGYDLHASEKNWVFPDRPNLIKTDLKIAIPEGYVGFIKPRSGLAAKHAIDTGAGVVDSNYRGEIGVVLFNHGTHAYKVKKGDRIAQLVVIPCYNGGFDIVGADKFKELYSDRGEKGYGSSGR